jgi:hypothetical protein
MGIFAFILMLFTKRSPTGISAEVIADSISTYQVAGKMVRGIRLTTFQLRYPRFIHAELMTHRVFSRNASSSRAIPVLTMLMQIIADPAMPIYWGANQSGMQAKTELTGFRRWLAIKAWRAARYPAVVAAFIAYKIGLHKQIANRICEPWAYISVLVTATEYQNWFNLRLHADAQPEIRELANLMDIARRVSEPQRLTAGQWHLPYVTKGELEGIDIGTAIKISVARCARVSYLTHDAKRPEIKHDIALFERLVGSVPLHASPSEHQASPDTLLIEIPEDRQGIEWRYLDVWQNPKLHGNLRGFVQYRKLLTGEFAAG